MSEPKLMFQVGAARTVSNSRLRGTTSVSVDPHMVPRLAVSLTTMRALRLFSGTVVVRGVPP